MSLTLEGARTVSTGLRIVRDLTAGLRREGVPYCHWKSNEHLEEGMLGITDLDMLFDRSASARLARVLSDCGYKRFAATPGRAYPGVEDYLGFDTETGKLIHLHLYYQLSIGENHLKGYHLPWESWVLSTRLFDEQAQIFVADPHMEMLLLLVRSVLKIRTRDLLLGALGRGYFRGGELVEYRWLKERIQTERLTELARMLVGEGTAGRLALIVRGEPSIGELLALRRSLRPILSLYRTYSAIGARLRRWVRELLWLYSAVGKRYTHPARPLSRTDPRGGLMIALMGSDGSGKSTATRNILTWLSWKIDARPVYFGSGDGPASLARWPLKLGLMALRGTGLLGPGGGSAPAEHDPSGAASERTGTSAAGAGTGPGGDPGGTRTASGDERLAGFKGALRALWALVLAFEKRRTLRRAWSGRNRGMVMICDRYPQNQIMGFNDGPLLNGWRHAGRRMRRAAGRWEAVPYQRAEAHPPDLVIKLHVSPDVARARKPEMELDEIRRRERAVTSLRFPASTVVDIDADRPWDEVLLEIKRRVWENL